MVLLNLQVLRRLSELITPAAVAASNASYGIDDRDPVLMARHIIYTGLCLYYSTDTQAFLRR